MAAPQFFFLKSKKKGFWIQRLVDLVSPKPNINFGQRWPKRRRRRRKRQETIVSKVQFTSTLEKSWTCNLVKEQFGCWTKAKVGPTICHKSWVQGSFYVKVTDSSRQCAGFSPLKILLSHKEINHHKDQVKSLMEIFGKNNCETVSSLLKIEFCSPVACAPKSCDLRDVTVEFLKVWHRLCQIHSSSAKNDSTGGMMAEKFDWLRWNGSI